MLRPKRGVPIAALWKVLAGGLLPVFFGCAFLYNYLVPAQGGVREDTYLSIGLALTGVGVIILVLPVRSHDRASRRIALVGMFLAMIGVGIVIYVAVRGTALPEEAQRALDAYVREKDVEGRSHAVDYVWLGQVIHFQPDTDDALTVSVYCVIIDPPLEDGRNAFFLQSGELPPVDGCEGSPETYSPITCWSDDPPDVLPEQAYFVAIPQVDAWKAGGCAHVDEVTNADFDLD